MKRPSNAKLVLQNTACSRSRLLVLQSTLKQGCAETRRCGFAFTSRPHARGASEHMGGISMHAHVGRLVLVCGGIVRASEAEKDHAHTFRLYFRLTN